jgi:hypothetical protein
MADYNGWTNWETWNVALWIGNDEGLYNCQQEFIRHADEEITGNDVRQYVAELLPNGTPDIGSSVIDDRRLADAIAAEQQRGRAGHWAFDVNRLLALRGHRLARRYELALDSRDRRAVPTYYDCGICGHCHNVEWNGDCREDARRHTCDDLDARFGPDGWRLVPMEDVL